MVWIFMFVVPAEAGGGMPQPALGPLGKGPEVPLASLVKAPVSAPASGADAPAPLAPVIAEASVPCEASPDAATEPDVAAPVPVAPPESPETAVELAPLVAASEPAFPELDADPPDAPVDAEPAGTGGCDVLAEHPVSPITKKQKRRSQGMSW
jgi:hypothetical protein